MPFKSDRQRKAVMAKLSSYGWYDKDKKGNVTLYGEGNNKIIKLKNRNVNYICKAYIWDLRKRLKPRQKGFYAEDEDIVEHILKIR